MRLRAAEVRSKRSARSSASMPFESDEGSWRHSAPASPPDGRGQVKSVGYHAGREARRIEPAVPRRRVGRDGDGPVLANRAGGAGGRRSDAVLRRRSAVGAHAVRGVGRGADSVSRRAISESRSPPTRFASAFSTRAASGCSGSRPTAAWPPRSSTAPAVAVSAPAWPSPVSSTSTGWAKAAATSIVSG